MSKTPSELLDYQSLKNKGLKLAENDFNTVFSTIIQGHDDTKRYLNVENDPNPAFRISDEDVSMGFSKTQDAINIHLGYLNLLSKNTTPIEYRDQLTCFVPDKFYVIFKYLYWLRLFGRESTIHYYQKHGNPKLKIAFPAVF
ncbi:MAG TPA: hypothetical protein VLG12_02575, partial [Candidatus Saccharimonadales bacterium]|nr:hypothetical protein [Candidatus Saccharimonadales bacterium]